MSRSRGISTTDNPACKTPGKRGFLTEEHLKKKICRDPAASGYKIYKCTCGYWHLSTKKKKKP